METDVHGHRVGLDDSLDFINTLEHSADADEEKLPNLETALVWLEDRALIDDEDAACERRLAGGPGRGGSTRLATIRRTRQAMREVVDAIVAGRPADPAAVETFNRTLRAREVLELIPSSDGVMVHERDGTDPVGEGLARLAEPLAELIADGGVDRLRVCASETCRYVFYDVSRGGRRIWCDMSTCGNRAKARRHRERTKTTPHDEIHPGEAATL